MTPSKTVVCLGVAGERDPQFNVAPIPDRPSLSEDDKRIADSLAAAVQVNREFYGFSREEMAAKIGWSRNRLKSREMLLAQITTVDLVKICQVLGPLHTWIIPPAPHDEGFRELREHVLIEDDDQGETP